MSEAVKEDESGGEWPDLRYQAWRDTRDTLHMCMQVAGKVRLALTPREPQWSNVPFGWDPALAGHATAPRPS